ncbi:MAG: hypothetical protein Q9165_002456 [Trypethelium subeluteriae]
MANITFPVLENGIWVTQTLDLSQVSDYNPNIKVPDISTANHLPPTPDLGLLSRTVIRTPIVNNILPARVRHESLDDAVFVGEDFIQIKQIHPEGVLEHIATKSDFGSKIWASRVLGQGLQPKDARNKNWENQSLGGDDLVYEVADFMDPMDLDTKQQSLPPQILALTLESQQLCFVFLRQMPDGSHEFRQMTIPLPTSLDYLKTIGRHLAVDPHSRAMAVGAIEGTFTIYQTRQVGQLQEDPTKDVRNWCPLQAQQILKVNGVILKMDFLYPSSADDEHVILVLIVSRNGRLQILSYAWDFTVGLEENPEETKLENIEEAEYQSPLLLIPIRNRRDFFLICEHGAFIYTDVLTRDASMDSFENFQQAPISPGTSKRAPLWTNWARPVRRYHYLHEGGTEFHRKPEELDFVYLLREDGAVAYLLLEGPDRHTITIGDATDCKGHFNAAFASPPLGYKDPDILIAAGSASDGCLRRIGDFYRPEGQDARRIEYFQSYLLSPIWNWSPATDIASSNIHNQQGSIPTSHPAILVTSGRQPYGMVAELRSGIDASPIVSAFEGDVKTTEMPTDVWSLPDLKGVTLVEHSTAEYNTIKPDMAELESGDLDLAQSGLTFPDALGQDLAQSIPAERGLVILSSYPTHSRLLRVHSHRYQWRIVEVDSPFFDARSPTIWAGSPSDGYFLQVTQAEVRVIGPPRSMHDLKDVTVDPSGSMILVATFNKRSRTLVVVSYDEYRYSMEIWVFGRQSDGTLSCEKADDVLLIPAEPTCITTHEIDGTLFIAVGTTSGTLFLSNWGASQGFTKLTTQALIQQKAATSLSQGLQASLGFGSNAIGSVCESLIVLTTKSTVTHAHTTHLLCGLRDGTVCSAPVLKSDDRDNRLSTVKLRLENEDSASSALAYNESDLCTIAIDPEDSGRLQVNKVLLKDDLGAYWDSGPIAACARIPKYGFSTGSELAGALICYSGQGLHIQKINNSSTAIPKRLPLESSPYRMMFCDWLRLFVVVGTKMTTKKAQGSISRRHNTEIRRATRGVLEFLRPERRLSGSSNGNFNDTIPGSGHKGQHCGTFELLKGERIFCLTQWTHHKSQGSKYGLILIGTGASDATSPREGRLLFIEAALDQSGEVTCKIKKQVQHSSPVRAIATFQRNYFICGVGKSLRMYAYEEREKKYDFAFYRVLPVQRKLTSSRLWRVVIQDNTPKFTIVALDHMARNSLTHLPLHIKLPRSARVHYTAPSQIDPARLGKTFTSQVDKLSLLLASDQENNIVGLHQRRAVRDLSNDDLSTDQNELARPHSNTAPLLITAGLSRSITRLHQAQHLRAPWKPQLADLPGVLENNIIGCATDGTIINLSLLSEAALKLTRFVYELYEDYEKDRKEEEVGTRWDGNTLNEREQAARKQMKHTRLDYMALAVGSQREGDRYKRNHHVDGDFLTRMIEQGGHKLLERIILGQKEETPEEMKVEADHIFGDAELDDAGPQDQATSAFSFPFPDPSVRTSRFSDRPDRRIRELAELVRVLVQEGEIRDVQRWEGDLITVTLRYLKDILEPII